MSADQNSDDSVGPPRSKSARAAELLEQALRTSANLGTRGMVLAGIVFLVYVTIGGLLTVIDSPLAPSNFLSMTADPWFYLTGFLVSIFVIQTTGSIILYYFLTDSNEDRSQFVLLMSYVGLGLGAAALRYLAPPTVEFLAQMV